MDVFKDGEIHLFGPVGDDFGFGDGFRLGDVYDALGRVGRGNDVTVRINSGGGLVDDGVGIFNALKAHRGKVTVSVEAIAASAASVIAMAGDDVVMRTGAVMMIHDPALITLGDAAEHERSMRALETLAAGMADIYAEKSGRSAEQCRADMKAETWFGATEAVNAGYADRSEDVEENAADTTPEPTAFDYRLYLHAPERLVALAAAKDWKVAPRSKAKTTPAAPLPSPTGPDSDAKVAEALEIARLCAAAGEVALGEQLIRAGATTAQARERLDYVRQVREKVASARRSFPIIGAALADTYIALSTPLDDVTRDLYERMAVAQSPEISTAHQPAEELAGGAAPTPGHSVSAKDIYARRRDARATRGNL
jgi:ATP-dependent protease ClpP protease subunit